MGEGGRRRRFGDAWEGIGEAPVEPGGAVDDEVDEEMDCRFFKIAFGPLFALVEAVAGRAYPTSDSGIATGVSAAVSASGRFSLGSSSSGVAEEFLS